jgi:tRNA A-37 threonylcarbamoyl transferase component Bud32
MGQVYLAHDIRLADKPCAVKELIPDPYATSEEREQATVQFRREAAILAHLSHSHLPNVYDYFEERGHFYLVMDYIEGETLAARLSHSPDGLSQDEVVEWAIQLCDVLEYLHDQRPPVVFRDMKPDNVMVTSEREVKLIDFGVARLFDPVKRTDTLKMGTAGYAPPEQYAGQGQTTPRSDIYALGVTLHELLTAADPTAKPFVFAPPRELNPAVSPALSEVVMQALNLGPDDRFPSAKAMRRALEKTRQPHRLRLPFRKGGATASPVQRQRGTGTVVMPEVAAVPAPRGRLADVAVRALRWVGRVALTVVLSLSIVALVLLLVGTFALSAIVERAVGNIDWELTEDTGTVFVMSEDELREGVQELMEPYALDTVSGFRADFRPPDEAVLSMWVRARRVSLQAHLEVREGVPAVILERVNEVPLYIIGGIVSGGINRGFQSAWEDSPIQVTSITVQNEQLTARLER